MTDKKSSSPQKARRSKKKEQTDDSPSIQIGEGVKDSNIIVGDNNKITTTKNINRIRNITNIIKNARPRDFILYTTFFLIALSGIFYLFWYNNLRYDRAISSGQLNILVVPFVEEKPWGYTQSGLGWNIAQIFTDGVKDSFEQSGIDINVKILGPSDKVPTIFGFNETQLNHSAETISEKINGQIVIYGVISKDEYGDSIVSVKFYISPTNFGEAQELISDSMMGELTLGSFRLTGDMVSGADLLAQNKELRDRLEIFSSIINFLGAYVGEDFVLAQDYITKASDQNLWSNTNGLEVVYLLNGNMEIRLARTLMVNKDLEGIQNLIDLARNHFNDALDVSAKNGKGDYVRAYLGLAGIESLAAIAKANIEGDVSLIDTKALENVLKFLGQAEKADYIPETADVTAKVNYSKAQVYLAYFAKTGVSKYLSDAQKSYQLVVDEFKKTDNKRIVDFAAFSYSGLGHIAAQNNQLEIAVDNFLSAQKITSNPSFKVQCLISIGDIYFSNKMYDKALKYYQDALARRVDLEKAISKERIIEIEKRIDFIKKSGGLL